MDETYINIRIKRTTKFDIERIAARYKLNTGETLDAGQVVEKAVNFFVELLAKETEKAKVEA